LAGRHGPSSSPAAAYPARHRLAWPAIATSRSPVLHRGDAPAFVRPPGAGRDADARGHWCFRASSTPTTTPTSCWRKGTLEEVPLEACACMPCRPNTRRARSRREGRRTMSARRLPAFGHERPCRHASRSTSRIAISKPYGGVWTASASGGFATAIADARASTPFRAGRRSSGDLSPAALGRGRAERKPRSRRGQFETTCLKAPPRTDGIGGSAPSEPEALPGADRHARWTARRYESRSSPHYDIRGGRWRCRPRLTLAPHGGLSFAARRRGRRSTRASTSAIGLACARRDRSPGRSGGRRVAHSAWDIPDDRRHPADRRPQSAGVRIAF